jgi:hypothetical protein
MGVS